MVQAPEELEQGPPSGSVAEGGFRRLRFRGFREDLTEQILVAVRQPALGRFIRQDRQEASEDFQSSRGREPALGIGGAFQKGAGFLQPAGFELLLYLFQGKAYSFAEGRRAHRLLERFP